MFECVCEYVGEWVWVYILEKSQRMGSVALFRDVDDASDLSLAPDPAIHPIPAAGHATKSEQY